MRAAGPQALERRREGLEGLGHDRLHSLCRCLCRVSRTAGRRRTQFTDAQVQVRKIETVVDSAFPAPWFGCHQTAGEDVMRLEG